MAKKWIQKALADHKPGALHKALDVKKGEKIPMSKLQAAAKEKGKLGKMANLAMTLRKINK
jgi:prephenate dehydratase